MDLFSLEKTAMNSCWNSVEEIETDSSQHAQHSGWDKRQKVQSGRWKFLVKIRKTFCAMSMVKYWNKDPERWQDYHLWS